MNELAAIAKWNSKKMHPKNLFQSMFCEFVSLLEWHFNLKIHKVIHGLFKIKFEEYDREEVVGGKSTVSNTLATLKVNALHSIETSWTLKYES